MKNLLVALFIPLFVCTALSTFGGPGLREDIEGLIFQRRHKGEPLLADDLVAYARINGVSDEEMSTLLMGMVQATMDSTEDPRQCLLADAALWSLIPFGGEKEFAFARQIMLTTSNGGLRLSAISVEIRLAPDNWKTLVEEICNDSRFSSHERFIACEEAYQIGRRGDKQTREAVEKFLSGLADREERPGTQNRLRRWAAELKDAE
jgi:hypothetical protein